MADEAIKVEGTGQTGNIRNFTVANSPAVPIHTLMFSSGDNTASFSAAGSGAMFLGISVSEKEAADGLTGIAVDTGGVWDLTASGTIARGHKCILAGGNRIQTVDNTTAALAASGGLVIGIAREAASDGEIIRVDLGVKS